MEDRKEDMDIQAYDDFFKSINLMKTEEMVFLYDTEKERGIRAVKSVIVEAEELGNFGERRIALENLLDNLSEVGLFLTAEQIYLADKAFGKQKNKSEQLLIAYYQEHLITK